jgi:hypothetical protein
MGKGAKIAIGCGCLLLLSAAAVVGVLGWGAWWAKGKLSGAAAGLEKMNAVTAEIERYEKQANAQPYTRPADGVIPEPRLVSFLATRKRVYSVYERYEPQLRALGKKAETSNDKLSASDLWSAGGTLAGMAGEIRLEQMKALAELEMSEAEYRDIQMAVYKSAWAAEATTESGKLPAEAVSDSMSEAAKQVQSAMKAGLEAAKKEGVPGSGNVDDADVNKVQEGVSQLGQQASQALYVPKANVLLFRKYQAEIQKYAMHGLAFVGL